MTPARGTSRFRGSRLGVVLACGALLASGCALRDGPEGTTPPRAPTETVGQPPADGGTETETATAARGAGLSTSGAQIVDESGTPVQLRSVNWFGLDTGACAPQGLWARPLGDILDQMKAAGFNAVRLPWSNQCVETGRPDGIAATQNPELVGLTTLELLDAVVAAAAERDLKLILAHHRATDGKEQELWYTQSYPEEQWLQDWVTLARRYASEPAVVGADLHNEPHGVACWGCGEPDRDWQAAATRAGNALHEVAPTWLVLVAGVQTAQSGSVSWWGSELSDVRTTPVKLEQPGKVVYATHDWSAAVAPQTWFEDASFPDNLAGVWTSKWGFLVEDDVAPVMLTGFGGAYKTSVDRQWHDTLVDYIDTRQVSFAYWAWNADTTTGGALVEEDWSTPRQAQRDSVAPLLD